MQISPLSCVQVPTRPDCLASEIQPGPVCSDDMAIGSLLCLIPEYFHHQRQLPLAATLLSLPSGDHKSTDHLCGCACSGHFVLVTLYNT